jgi:hypothetical protein
MEEKFVEKHSIVCCNRRLEPAPANMMKGMVPLLAVLYICLLL